MAAVWFQHKITPHDLSLDKRSLGSLAKKYLGSNSSANVQLIAKTNGVAWTPSAINAWVTSVGGKEITPGNFSFVVGNQIMLPWPPVMPGPGDADAPVPGSPAVASALTVGGAPWWAWLGLAAGGVWLYRLRKKKKSGGKKTASASIVRF